MRKPERIPVVLDAIRKIWEQHPDLRLGQLLSFVTPDGHDADIFYWEDDQIIKTIYKIHAPGETPPVVEVFPAGGRPHGFGVVGREKEQK